LVRSGSHKIHLTRLHTASTPKAKWLSSKDIIWDQIKSIEYIGYEQVYDLSVEDTHNFIANDIYLHNSWLILRIAEAFARRKLKFLLFSMELSAEIIVGRLHLMNLPKTVLKHILISDEVLSPAEAKLVARRAKEVGAAAVGVDYNELFLYGEGVQGSESTASSGYMAGHLIAKQLEIPVIYLAQFKRTYGQALPTIQDLRFSGMGERASRLVLLGHNPSQALVGRPDSQLLPYEQSVAYLIVGKSTFGYVHGSAGAIKIPWNSEQGNGRPGWGDVSLGWIPMQAV
jgi:replicative DNA helicase